VAEDVPIRTTKQNAEQAKHTKRDAMSSLINNSAPFLKKQKHFYQKIKENQFSFYRKNHSLKQ